MMNHNVNGYAHQLKLLSYGKHAVFSVAKLSQKIKRSTIKLNLCLYIPPLTIVQKKEMTNGEKQ